MKKTLIIVSLWAISALAFAPPPHISEEQRTENYLRQAELTEENLKIALALTGVESAEWVYAQALLETGNFESNLCKEHNNLFGMKKPIVRTTTAIGRTDSGFAVYRCWYDSVRDMALFQDFYRERGRNIDNYLDFLSMLYAEDEWYIHKLKKIVSLHKIGG